MWIRSGVSIALIGILGAGCSGGGDPARGEDTTSRSVKGSVIGTQIPQQAKAVVIWSVSSGSPDYSYKYGEGTFRDAKFTVSLPGDVPTEAINSYGIGIGVVALVPPGTPIPDGRVSGGEHDGQATGAELEVLGFTTEYAIIWKTASARDLSWSSSFPVGMSCGICLPAVEGEVFDSFVPIDCSTVKIETASDPDELHACNWT